LARILLAEDDTLAAQLLKDVLEGERHTVDMVHDGNDALSMLSAYSFDILILDITMPGLDGLSVLKEFRSNGGLNPVLILSGRGKSEDKSLGLDLGADDYMSKPYDVRELSSRIRALLRRDPQLASEIIQCGNLKLDSKAGKLHRGLEEIKLLPKEYLLLEFLMRHQNQLFSAQDLLNKVWPSDSDATEIGVRTTVARIRKKLGEEESTLLQSIYGLGYRFGTKE
jgi:DNA-binding response OmpR family regulator